MPNLRSNAKSVRKDKKKRLKNRTVRSKIHTLAKRIDTLAKENKQEEAVLILNQYYKAIDKASSKGIFKKNNVGRKKSRMAKLISSVKENLSKTKKPAT